jgi:hypothetical protein
MDQKEYQRQYRLKNKEKRAKKFKEIYEKKKNSPQFQKQRRIYQWKRQGLIDDGERIHAIWEETNECMKCEKAISGRGKCMDHDHVSGLFRAMLCRGCNNGNVLDLHPEKKKKLQEKYIREHLRSKGCVYEFRKQTTGHEDVSITFDSLAESIKYRDEYIDGLINRNSDN